MDDMGQSATAIEYRTEADAMRRSGGLYRRPASLPASLLDRAGILTRAVERDVIPRMVLARRQAMRRPSVIDSVTPAQVNQLADITLAADERATAGFVAAMRDQGFAAEALYLDLLAPAARRLGEFWVDDICDFTEVTIGLWRLHNAMRDLSPEFLRHTAPGPLVAGRSTPPRILLVPLPGEQHTFGLSMVFDFFRRAGWDAWTGPVESAGELTTMLRSQWVDVLGFSLACDEGLETARTEIARVRQASRNPAIVVMAGGPPFLANAGLAEAVGADGTAQDGLQAIAAAASLVQRNAARR